MHVNHDKEMQRTEVEGRLSKVVGRRSMRLPPAAPPAREDEEREGRREDASCGCDGCVGFRSRAGSSA